MIVGKKRPPRSGCSIKIPSIGLAGRILVPLSRTWITTLRIPQRIGSTANCESSSKVLLLKRIIYVKKERKIVSCIYIVFVFGGRERMHFPEGITCYSQRVWA